MKSFLFFSIVCLIISVLSLVFPYESHGESQLFTKIQSDKIYTTTGLEIIFAYVQFIFLLGISVLVILNRNFIGGLLALVLGAIYIIYIVVLGIYLDLLGLFTENKLEIGFYLAALVCLLYFAVLVFNFIYIIRLQEKNSKRNNPDLLDF